MHAPVEIRLRYHSSHSVVLSLSIIGSEEHRGQGVTRGTDSQT